MGATSSSPPPPRSTDPSTRPPTTAPRPAGALCRFTSATVRARRRTTLSHASQPPPSPSTCCRPARDARLRCGGARGRTGPRGRDGARGHHQHRDGCARHPHRRSPRRPRRREPGRRAGRARIARRPPAALGRAPRRLRAVGITLPAPPAEPVFLRGLVGGTWTPWFEADFAEDETPDPGREGARAGAHSQPVWLGSATAYEIDGPASVTTVQVHLVADEMHGGSVTIQSPAAGAASAPGIIGRAAWGARPPPSGPCRPPTSSWPSSTTR